MVRPSARRPARHSLPRALSAAHEQELEAAAEAAAEVRVSGGQKARVPPETAARTQAATTPAAPSGVRTKRRRGGSLSRQRVVYDDD